MKRKLSAVIVLAIVLGVLSGCKNGADSNNMVALEIEKIIDTSDECKESGDEAALSEDSASKQMEDCYIDFINGNAKATVRVDRIEWLENKKAYTYDEMNQLFIEDTGCDDVTLSNEEYAFIDCGNDGIPELIVGQVFMLPMDEAKLYSIFKYIDGELFLISLKYGYCRTEINVNNYGYITESGSGGAVLYEFSGYYVNADGEEIFLYSEDDEMGMHGPVISEYNFPTHSAPEGYYDMYCSDPDSDGEYTTVRYNFTEYVYTEDDSEYYSNNFYTFYDGNAAYAEPSPELKKIYDDNGLMYYECSEAERMIKEHEESLGVTDEIRGGNEIKWESIK